MKGGFYMENDKNISNRPQKPRKRKRTKEQIFKEDYLPLIIAGAAIVMITIFIIGSITRGIQRIIVNKEKRIENSIAASIAKEEHDAEAEMLVKQAEALAMSFDYEGAVSTLESFSGNAAEYPVFAERILQYNTAQSQLVVWPDNSKYDGDWVADSREGKGTFYYVNGDRYVGDWKADVQHGKGIYHFSSGDRYEGDYVDGERTGQGIYVHKNGDKYVGAFQNGEQSGLGTFTWSNGAVYEGEWVDNVRSGKGRYKWANGDEYEGDWKNDMPHGEGSLTMADGTRYKGGFSKGMEEGKGVMLTPDGIRFEGSFKQGKKHGPFVETDKEGKVVRKGVYKFGTLDVAQK